MKNVLFLLLIFGASGCIDVGKCTESSIHDQPKRYSLEEWERLGFDVWKDYYTPKHWNVISQNSEIVEYDESRTKCKIDEILSDAMEKGILVNRANVEIVVGPLIEMEQPIHRWFWFPRRDRAICGFYRVMYENSCLGSVHVNLPVIK